MEIYLPILIGVQVLFFVVLTVFLYSQNKASKELVDAVNKQSKVLGEQPKVIQPNPVSETSFLPILVHELRSPISIIKGASDLVLKDAKDLSADQIHTLLTQIRTSSNGLLSMVNDILDMSKIEAGKFNLTKSSANICDVLKEECSYFDAMAKMHKVALLVNCSTTVQNFSFDPERIKQVMNNLLSNAIKFTPEGGSIEVYAQQIDHYVEVSVVDTGVGIPAEEKSMLFHKFVQATNHNKSKEKGTGLGLVIAKGIIEAHGGRIWIEDNTPTGSKFIFSLPI